MKKNEDIKTNDNKSNSWWNSTKNSFKRVWRNAKESLDGMVLNMNIQSAFNDKTFEFRIENPEEVLFMGDKIYGIIDDEKTYILFRKTNNILNKIKVGTLLSQINTFNQYFITSIDEKTVLYPVTIKDQNITVECYKMFIKEK